MVDQIVNENSADWESGKLGREEEFVEKVSIDENMLNNSLKLKAVSIRLQESMIEDLKLIGKLNGIGYQPLMRQVLNRFIECEKKRILRESVSLAQKEEIEDDIREEQLKTA